MMDDSNKQQQSPVPETVSCAVCQREIPRTDALKDEGDEYIRWFCGFDCYHRGQQDKSPDS